MAPDVSAYLLPLKQPHKKIKELGPNTKAFFIKLWKIEIQYGMIGGFAGYLTVSCVVIP